jgi:nickel transport protein
MAPMVAPQASLRLALLAGGCGLVLLCAPGARAHGIESTLERLGSLTSSSPYQLESRFSSGVPARDAAVRMVSPDGVASVDLGHTNAEGQLTFRLPAQARADWEVQVDAGPGHRDYVELPSSAPATLHSDSALSHPALARSLRSLGVVALLGTMAGLLLHRPRR